MSNFIHGCGRLCALAMIVGCTSPLGLGHDLPHDRILPEQTTWNCFSAVGHQADPATSHSQNHGQENSENATLFTTVLGNQVWLSELPLPSPTANYLHAWQTFTSQAAQVLESIIRPLGQIQLPVNSARSNSTCDLVIAQPETGTAPRPKAKGIREHDNILAHALKLIEDAQCHASQALFDRANLQQTIAKHAYNGFQTVSSLADKFAAPNQRLASDSAQSIGTQYVVFETSVGGHILLTVAQAQQWQFAVPTARDSVAKFLTSTGSSLQQRACTAISSQLAWVGKSLLDLSQAMSQFAPAKVADRSSSYR